MSRTIDFSQPLSEEDTEYVRQREWLARDAELSGQTVQYFGDVPETDETTDETGADEEEAEDVTYDDLSVDDLKAEIAARNEEREDEDDHIKVDSKAKKADLIAALEADDETHPETEEA